MFKRKCPANSVLLSRVNEKLILSEVSCSGKSSTGSVATLMMEHKHKHKVHHIEYFLQLIKHYITHLIYSLHVLFTHRVAVAFHDIRWQWVTYYIVEQIQSIDFNFHTCTTNYKNGME